MSAGATTVTGDIEATTLAADAASSPKPVLRGLVVALLLMAVFAPVLVSRVLRGDRS